MHADRELIQIVDAALAEAVRKSGAWLVCRPGCCECCIGPFAITQLDVARLRAGLAELDTSDPARAARVRERTRAAAEKLPPSPVSSDDAAFEAWVEALPDEDYCPALDPEAGTCDLYTARPVTCRVFGPPIRWGGDAVGVCELCFVGATDEDIVACEVQLDISDREPAQTLVALALTA